MYAGVRAVAREQVTHVWVDHGKIRERVEGALVRRRLAFDVVRDILCRADGTAQNADALVGHPCGVRGLAVGAGHARVDTRVHDLEARAGAAFVGCV